MSVPVTSMAVAALAGGAVWACAGPAGEDRDGAVAITVDTIAGVEHVRSAGEAPRWALERIVELGSAGGVSDTAAADEFAWVSSVALGPEGRLYVADLGNSHVRVFDTAGGLVTTIGRQGQGPGEFEELFSIAWLSDTLLAFDPVVGRVGLFSESGAWLGSSPAAGRRLTASPVTFRLYAVGRREVYQSAYRPGGAEGYESTWRRHGGTGPDDEWAQLSPMAPRSFPDKVVCTMGRGFSWFDHPYVPRAFEHPAPGNRAYAATSDTSRVVLMSNTGDTLRVIDRFVEPPRLLDEEWARTAERFDRWLADKDRNQCRPSTLHRPERKPVVEALMVDVEGRLWVERNLERGTVWEVFDRRGRLVGAVDGFAHDRQRTVPWLGTDHVAWVSRDSLDLPRVHLAWMVPESR